MKEWSRVETRMAVAEWFGETVTKVILPDAQSMKASSWMEGQPEEELTLTLL